MAVFFALRMVMLDDFFTDTMLQISPADIVEYSRDFLAASKRKESWEVNNRVELFCKDPNETDAAFLRRILNAFRSCPNTIKLNLSGARNAIEARCARDDQGKEGPAKQRDRDAEQAVANVPTQALMRILAEGGKQTDEINEIRSHFAHLLIVSLTYANCDWTALALLLDFLTRYSTTVQTVMFYEVPTLARKSEINKFTVEPKNLSEEQSQLIRTIERLDQQNESKSTPQLNKRPLGLLLRLDLRVFNHDYRTGKGNRKAEKDLNGQCILEEGWTKTLQYFGQDLHSLSFNSRGIYEPHMPYLIGKNFPKLKSLKLSPGSIALSDYKYLSTLSLKCFIYGEHLRFEGLEILAGLKSFDPMSALFDNRKKKKGKSKNQATDKLTTSSSTVTTTSLPPPPIPEHNLRRNLLEFSFDNASNIRTEREMSLLSHFTHLQSLTLNEWFHGKPSMLRCLFSLSDLSEFNMYGIRLSNWGKLTQEGLLSLSQETKDVFVEWRKNAPKIKFDFSFAED